MDEPLSNLDAKLRQEMRTELKRLHSDTNSTFVYVTHDQLEAMTLSTKVCLMDTAFCSNTPRRWRFTAIRQTCSSRSSSATRR